MNKSLPIKKRKDLENFLNYYKTVKPNLRNHLLLIFGLNTGLRVSDILSVKWKNIYDFDSEHIRTHLNLSESKTGKRICILVNVALRSAIIDYQDSIKDFHSEDYVFVSQKSDRLSRYQAYRIVRDAARGCNIEGIIACHSMRKTFAYYAYKQGASPAMIMSLLNHSSFEVTKRYIGIEQDEKDQVYRSIYR